MRTVAVLVVLDSRSAAGAPRLSRALRRVLRLALEPAALALDNARRIQHAERLAGTDDLTGLFNVRALTDRLRRELARASRTGQPLSLAVLDLDGFKRVNDSHGHPRGSRVLIELAALLRSSMRDTDFVARLGGDEFSVVLPDTAADGAVAAGDRLRARIARHVFLQREGLRVRLTASVGTATVSGADVKADVLLERADGALYQAKAGGGNRTACDGPGPAGERAT
jgi:diguanylate cyclase (GGDEF)-like protein